MSHERRNEKFSVKRIGENLFAAAVAAGVMVYVTVAVLKEQGRILAENQKEAVVELKLTNSKLNDIDKRLTTAIEAHIQHDAATEVDTNNRLNRLEKTNDRRNR